MADKVCIDYRRTDQRTTTLENPFWITSGSVSNAACAGLGALLFSFPRAGQLVLIHEVLMQNVVLAVTGTTVDIGYGTIATNAITTGGNILIGTADLYMKNTDYAVTANTVLGPTTGNTSTWLTAKAANNWAAARYILGAATAVPVVYATVGAGFTAGTFRVHMLVTILPGT